MINIDLSGKVALVTGASQGIGEATARALHRAGASVVINYHESNSQASANRIVAELGDRSAAIEGDIVFQSDIDDMIDLCFSEFGGIDIVINNAGIICDKTIKKISMPEWQDVIDTNLTGTFNMCRSACGVIGDGGRIVNISSISGVIGFYGQVNYAASKAGIIAVTKVLSKELAKRRITVNAIAPGVVLTKMGKKIPEDIRNEMLKDIPLGRFGEPEEIANTVLFLCSDLASYITGQTIHVNGGIYG